MCNKWLEGGAFCSFEVVNGTMTEYGNHGAILDQRKGFVLPR